MVLSNAEYEIGTITRSTNMYHTRTIGRVYYYQGNFFHPLNLINDEQGRVMKMIRTFIKENKTLVQSDRADKDYRNLLQLANLE